MASWFSGSGTVVNRSRLPAGITREHAIKTVLQDHDFFLHCNPQLAKCEQVTAPATPPGPVPKTAKVVGDTKVYLITDLVHTLPAGLWDSNVESTYELTNIEGGIYVRVKSPMSIVIETLYTVGVTADGGLEVVDDATVHGSKLLLPTVKGLINNNYVNIHRAMIAKLEGKPAPQKEAGKTTVESA